MSTIKRAGDRGPAVTYKTVISNAIIAFNDIQTKIYENSGQLSQPSSGSGASTTAIINALKSADVSVSQSLTATSATLSTTDSSSGVSFKGSGNANVTTAGLISAGTGKANSSSTKYLTALTIGTGKTLNSLTSNGLVKIENASTGKVQWNGWNIYISKSTDEDILVFDPIE